MAGCRLIEDAIVIEANGTVSVSLFFFFLTRPENNINRLCWMSCNRTLRSDAIWRHKSETWYVEYIALPWTVIVQALKVVQTEARRPSVLQFSYWSLVRRPFSQSEELSQLGAAFHSPRTVATLKCFVYLHLFLFAREVGGLHCIALWEC